MAGNIEDAGNKALIEPWLSINYGEQAVDFYKSAFGAVETYRLNDPDGGLVVRLSFNGAGLWISSEKNPAGSNIPVGGNTIRMILIVDDPEIVFDQAIKAGATEIFPIGEEYGWHLGRLSDPFGLHWEIGYQLRDSENK